MTHFDYHTNTIYSTSSNNVAVVAWRTSAPGANALLPQLLVFIENMTFCRGHCLA